MPRFSGTPEEPTQGGRFGGKLEVATEAAAPEMVPSYDPMGTFTGYTEAAPVATNMPYSEQMRKLGQTAKGFGKAALAGVASVPGETYNIIPTVEQLGRTGLKAAGVDVSTKPTMPYTQYPEKLKEMISRGATPAEKVGIELGYPVGSFLGPGLFGKAAEVTGIVGLGKTSEARESVASALEKIGIKSEPMQVRRAGPKGSSGFLGQAEENQNAANIAASKPTGETTKKISREFINKRLTDLGADYDTIFKRPMKVDSQMLSDMRAISDLETRVGVPASQAKVKAAADNILNRAVGPTGTTVTRITVDGTDLQRLREAISDLSRRLDGSNKISASMFVDSLDAGIERNQPGLRKLLQETNKKYAATKTLENMIEENSIQGNDISLQRLGDYVARNSYGYGSGTSRHPHAELGFLGREGKVRALWEGADETGKFLSDLLSKFGRVAPTSLVTRSQLGRKLQRDLSREEGIFGTPTVTPTITAGEAALTPDRSRGR
jgi:hypothetical protein